MGLFNRLAGGMAAAGPRSEYQDAGGGIEIDLGNPEHVAYLRGGAMTESGIPVNENGLLKIATAWRCLHVIAGSVANLPFAMMERVNDRERRPAVHAVGKLVDTRPNGWQTPQDFKRMLTAHLVLRGNAYALKITSMGRIIDLWPMHPDRVRCDQADDKSLRYVYTTKNGQQIPLQQDEVLHLRGLSLDGVTGLGVLAFARETLGMAIQGQRAAAKLWKQGTIAPGALKSPNALSDIAYQRLQDSLEDRRQGVENFHKWMILEEGLDLADLSFSAADLQFLESRQFDRSDVCTFFGVPEFLAGITNKDSNWGTGLEQRGQAFVTFTLEDYLTSWEQCCRRDLLTEAEAAKFYFRFVRAALVRSDLKGRWEAYVKALQWGVYSPNEVRELEDDNPRPDGDIYYPPPNTAGDASKTDNAGDQGNEEPPPQRA